MDVDGIEHLILKGGTSILRSPQLKTMLIEVNDDFAEQSDMVMSLLEKLAGNLKINYMLNGLKNQNLYHLHSI